MPLAQIATVSLFKVKTTTNGGNVSVCLSVSVCVNCQGQSESGRLVIIISLLLCNLSTGDGYSMCLVSVVLLVR